MSIGLLLLSAWSLAAEDDGDARVSTTINDDLEIRYYIEDQRLPDPDDVPVFNYIEQVNRFNATVATGDLLIEAQIDEVALFANQYYLDDVLRTERDLVSDELFSPLPDYSYATLEKIRARIDKGSYTVDLGDTYAAFGRGIALNVNRNVDIDIDTSIQGAKGVFRPGAWDLTIVAGQLNRQQVFQDNPNMDLFGDTRHGVGAVRVERFGLGPANVGVHGVYYDFISDPGWGPGFSEAMQVPVKGRPNATTFGGPDVWVGGSTLELLGVAGIDWYLEGDVFAFPTGQLPSDLGPEYEDKPGYAAYGSAAFYPGRTVWLVEGKRYLQAERVNSLLAAELYEVAIAPSLEYERAINEDTSAAMNSNDIWGGRVRMDYALKPGELIPFVSLAAFRDNDLGAIHFNTTPETIVHGVTGLELIREHGAALVNVGYRRDQRDQDQNAKPNCDLERNRFACDPGADQQIHGDLSVKFPVGPLHAEIATDMEHWRWGYNEFQQDDYTEFNNGLTLQRGSAIAVSWFMDYSDNPLVSSTGNVSEDVYTAVEVQYKPTSAITTKAFYGAYKAGIRCAGGQCRLLPGFEGVRMSVVGSF